MYVCVTGCGGELLLMSPPHTTRDRPLADCDNGEDTAIVGSH